MKSNFLKIENYKLKIGDFRRGMTYVEFIVVLSIFATMTAVVLFNYGDFQSKVEIKNLGSDIALKIVEAQKSSLSGLLPPTAQQLQINSTWKPSYGVYFNIAPATGDNKSFTFFTDLMNPVQNGLYDFSSCPGSGECLDKITIIKGNIISNLDVFYQGGSTAALNDLTVAFIRPNSGAIIKSTTPFTLPVSYVEITIRSPKSMTAKIKIYPSGRIQVN